jgi:hypothetical protein
MRTKLKFGSCFENACLALSRLLLLGVPSAVAQETGSPKQYTLKPTPKTVAWGYYDAKAAPKTVASGYYDAQ